MYPYAHPLAFFNALGAKKADIGHIFIKRASVSRDGSGNVLVNGQPNATATAYYNAFANRQVFIEEVHTSDIEMGVSGEADKSAEERATTALSSEEIASIINDTRETQISVVKKYSGDRTTPVVGATYTVYADGDVYNRYGKIIYTDGEEIESAVTELDDNGNAVAKFTDLHFVGLQSTTTANDTSTFYINKYIIKETEAPKGYLLSDQTISTNGFTTSVGINGLIVKTEEPLIVDFSDFEDYQTGTISAFKYDNYADDSGNHTPLSLSLIHI